MKLVYLTNSRIPTEKAHGIQIMKMCEAFARAGARVTLVVPRRKNPLIEDPFVYYNVQRIFSIVYVPTLDLVRFGHCGFIIQSITYALSAFFLVRRSGFADIVFSRDEYSLLLATWFTSFSTIYEAHDPRWNWIIRTLMKYVDRVVITSGGLKKYYVAQGVPESRMHVAPNAIDPEQFGMLVEQNAARKQLGLPVDKKVLVYTGHLYDSKGARTLLEIAQSLSHEMLLVVVGGIAQDIEKYKKITATLNTIMYVGKQPHTLMPVYLQAADALIIPNSGKSEFSRLHTSPIKLFEYMSSRRPIIASDLPSLREILSDETAYFAEADNAESFISTINHVFLHKSDALIRADKAYGVVMSKYTWDVRAHNILLTLDRDVSTMKPL